MQAAGLTPRPAGSPLWRTQIALAAAYLILAWLSLHYAALPGSSASPIWPPTGLAIAALYVGGRGLWPALFAGAALANLLFMAELGFSGPAAVLVAIAVGVGNAAEAAIAVMLVRRAVGEGFPFASLRGLISFTSAVALGALLSAGIGVATTRALGMGAALGAPLHGLAWWLGDVSAALVVAPALILLARRRHRRGRPRWLEAAALALSLLAIGQLSFVGVADFDLPAGAFLFLLLPGLLWAVIRFRSPGAACALLLISSLAIIGTASGQGPFQRAVQHEALLVLQLFTVVIACATWSLTATLHERDRLSQALAQNNSELRKLAYFDPLTGLANRRLLQERLDQALRRIDREGGSAALLYLDLDRFKRINDSMGHEVGDQLLQLVAQRVTATVQAGDTVCRLGGDEFVVLLDPVSDRDAVAQAAERILGALRQPVRLQGIDIVLTTSIGAVLLPAGGQRGTDALREADAAMYRAKQRGRNDVHFAGGDESAGSDAVQQEARLRAALAGDALRLCWQPIVGLASNEALGLRPFWRWPDGDGDPDGESLRQLAEASGLLGELEQRCQHAAEQQLALLQDDSPLARLLALPLSTSRLRLAELGPQFDRLMQRTPVDTLWLEVNWAEVLAVPELIDRLHAICASGRIGLVLSFSELASTELAMTALRGLPIELILIEPRLAAELSEQSRARDIAAAAVNLAHAMQLKVIAAGISNAQQAGFLAACGCDYGCGSHFPLDQLDAAWRERRMPVDG